MDFDPKLYYKISIWHSFFMSKIGLKQSVTIPTV